MSVRLGDDAPNFIADTTEGKIDFYEWKGDSWAVLFSHPKDFTPVCTTELGHVARLKGEFGRRDTKVIGLSVDSVETHEKWLKDIEDVSGIKMNYPLIGDPDHTIAEMYDMLPAHKGTELSEVVTVRSVYVIGPDNKVKLTLTYPASTGRNFDELLRVIDSLQLTARHQVATPADWRQGQDVIITTAVTDDEADRRFPGYRKIKPYLRTTPLPS
jgi:alkyl hydroperoxide reductase subunit AhpC